MTLVTITSPLGGFSTTRDPGTGERVLAVDGIGVDADGVVYYQPEGADNGEAAVLTYDPTSGAIAAVKETA